MSKFETFNWQTTQDDIYHNKMRYEHVRKNLDAYLKPPKKDDQRKYYIRFPGNLKYFKIVLMRKDAEGASYIRRIGLFYSLLLLCHVVKKDLAKLSREDVDEAMAFVRVRVTPKNQSKWVEDIKHIAKIVVPELDEKGRPDDTVVPYAFRHLSGRIDMSKQKRKEVLGPDDVVKIIQFFRQDSRLQALLALCYESLARPQELLWLRVRDVEVYDNYAKIWVSEHGKEGTKFLECVDSFPYITKWYNEHPLRHKPDAFLFCNLGDSKRHGQMSPANVNKHLRNALAQLGITKQVTLYTFKRSGVTHLRLAGESDAVIQHKAGWTSTAQLKTYDYSQHEDTFKLQLIKRGLMIGDTVPEALKNLQPEYRKCAFCGRNNGVVDVICGNCQRPLDRKKILEEVRQKEAQISDLQEQMKKFNEVLNELVAGKTVVIKDAGKVVLVEKKK
ncbi:Tyrosine recombinase XerC [uncultured archaeon]|nr:Tyrosine recombinase XerC [uncultured archaeon]